MASCYLTIDDSPSSYTEEMVDYLSKKGIPALLFVRGDLLDKKPGPIIHAIQKGFVIGNHSYTHKPYGTMTVDECIADIEKCDALINEAYHKAGVLRTAKYFRFPYLDRGNGDRIERHFESVTDININSDEKVCSLQNYLGKEGYVQPFPECNHPVYQNTSIANARDCLMTFTSFDWMLTERHRGKWDYKTIDDLKNRIDSDTNLKSCSGNIMIFHDQQETFETFKTLIDHMIDSGYDFLSYP